VKSVRRTLVRLKRFDKQEQAANRHRCEAAIVILLLLFVTLGARLWYLQAVSGQELRAQSERNRLRLVRLEPPRGKLLDRAGRLLAGVEPSFNVCLVREEARDIEATLAELVPILGEPEAVIRTRLALGAREPLYVPIAIKRGVDWETLSRIEARLFRLPGVLIEITPGRQYPHGGVAPHLLGYLGEVSQEELESRRFPGIRPGDLVGKSGIEARFDAELSGVRGQRWVEVDAAGRHVRVLGEVPPVPGNDLYLTIDLDLQQAAEAALGEDVGAVVAMDPQSGRLLALASAPGYDPLPFTTSLSQGQWDALNDPARRPLQNKAIQGRYAPGSTFKIVMAAAGLEEGVIDVNTSFRCTSSFRLGTRTFRCWDWRGHGQTNLYKALVESCDVYFYNVGLRLGIETMTRYARDFGLGSQTGIDLADESGGFIPTPEWKLGRFRERWQEGETLNAAIGQGFTLVTPLQMACLTAAVANGGELYRPVYLERVQGPAGQVLRAFEPEPRRRLPVSAGHLLTIQKALTGVVNDKRGTGKSCRLDGVHVAGKTGTAQVVKQAKRRQDEKMAWQYRDHAWFVAYAPAENPQLAVAVIVEHGGHGGATAAPVARKVFDRWFQLQTPRPVLTPQRTARSQAIGGVYSDG